jgi:methionyl-tRNA formyltransferase
MAEKKTKIVYCGTDDFAVIVLEDLLRQAVPVACVITTPPSPAGRGLRTKNSAVFECCLKHRLKSVQPYDLRDDKFQEFLGEYAGDLFVVVSYGKIIPPNMLALSRYPIINLHPSLLPKWRGPSPIETVLLRGEERTGVSIIALSEVVDGGDILAQKEIALDDTIDVAALGQRLAVEGAELLKAVIDGVIQGSVKAVPQDAAAATQTRKITKQDGLIDWSDTTRAIHNKIRALCLWPGAYTSMNGKYVRIFSATRVTEPLAAGVPGEIIALDNLTGVRVRTGDGALDLLEVQVEGKRRMDAFQFSLGARLKPGDRLGVIV